MKNRVFVAGHSGMTGTYVIDRLKSLPEVDIITLPKGELDLENQGEVNLFFENNNIDSVILIAAAVGGIKANTDRELEFLHRNIMIGQNVVWSAYNNGIKNLLNISSAAIYSKELYEKKICEDDLYKGPFASGTEGYALAKLTTLKACEYISRNSEYNYVSLIPTNIYGPYDNFSLEYSHVIAALIRKFHEAKKMRSAYVELWGSGNAEREFLFVEDFAEIIKSCLLHIEELKYKKYNISSGQKILISELANTIKKIVGFTGDTIFNEDKPEGVKKRELDISRMKEENWYTKTSLIDGLKRTYSFYIIT